MQQVTEQIAQRYAEALKDLGLSQEGLVDRLGDDCRAVQAVLAEAPELGRFLGSPLVGAEDKKKLLVRAFEGQVHPYMLNFLQLLVDRRRIVHLFAICGQYLVLLRKLQQTVLADAISAVPLSEEQRSALVERIKNRTRAVRVELRNTVDPDLLGGMILKIGDEVIDASLRGQLRKLTLQLTLS